MSNFLLDIIMADGFELYQGKHLDYSSMRKDGLDSRYRKGDMIFIWGLNEANHPPTLVYPRPKILSKHRVYKRNEGFKEVVCFCEFSDDVMNKCLSVFSHEDIYQGILNDWTFDLIENKINKTNEQL